MDTNRERRNELLLQPPPSEAIAKGEPLLMSGPNPKLKNSPHSDREDRARALVVAWGGTVKGFVLAHFAEIVQVREDFLNKAKSKTIWGCKTWEEYVTQKLNCSSQHIRRLLAGDNPATEIHDGSANRQSKPVTETVPTTEKTPLVPSGIPTIDRMPEVEEGTFDDEVEQTEDMSDAEYAEALIEARLENVALVVARKVLTDLYPAKSFVYGNGGMDKRNGKALREEFELRIQESLPDVYKSIIRVAQRLLVGLPVMPERLLTCPKCGNQMAGTFESLSAPNNGSRRYQCQKCDHKASTRKFKYLPPMQPTIVETVVHQELTNPMPLPRKKTIGPADIVNLDELPPEARARMMAQIEQTAAM